MGKKYFTISYDDGLCQDAVIIRLMQNYGIRGTFNINSGLFGSEGKIRRLFGDIGVAAGSNSTFHCVDAIRASAERALQLYDRDGVEVASHGTHHVFESKLTPQEMQKEITADVRALEELFGQKIHGHIFPFGTYNEDALHTMKGCGVVYGRKATMFQKPEDFSFHCENGIITPTCWHLDSFAEEYLRRFIDAPAQEEDQVFYLWGHGYELDYNTKRGNYDYLERLFRMVAHAPHIEFVTNYELVSQLKTGLT